MCSDFVSSEHDMKKWGKLLHLKHCAEGRFWTRDRERQFRFGELRMFTGMVAWTAWVEFDPISAIRRSILL